MSKLEDELAAYLLGLQRGPWTKRYNMECLRLWRERYGDRIADRVEKIVSDKWKPAA